MRTKRFFFLIMIIFILGGGIVAIGNNSLFFPQFSSQFPIKILDIQGTLQQTEKIALAKTLRSAVKGNFFTLDLDNLYAKVLALPWIESAKIQRIWPDTVQIQIVEHHVAARWGEKQLISQKGVVFSVVNMNPYLQLPILAGPLSESYSVLQECAKIQQLLTSKHIFMRCTLNQRGEWQVDLVSDIAVILGKKELLQRVSYLVNYYDYIQKIKEAQIKQIDLRYTNGFAVAWRDK